MVISINEEITVGPALMAGYLHRDGFVFCLGDTPSVFDRLVIRVPQDASALGVHGFSQRTLQEHIDFINRYALVKATIVCDDISFLVQCPTLTDLRIYPTSRVGSGFDYSPLYQMPHIQKLFCQTVYNGFSTTIDYTRVTGIEDISVTSQGHIGYDHICTLKKLFLSNVKTHRDFRNISCSSQLSDVTLMCSGIQTLDGIEKHHALRSLALFHNRSLTNIMALSHIAKSLQTLAIESCPKIQDFSVLKTLVNLEHLQLYGNNTLPDLTFLSGMKQLKTFTFTMNIANGDLRLCTELPYASCKNRKHYNLKDSQLPKNKTGDGSGQGTELCLLNSNL